MFVVLVFSPAWAQTLDASLSYDSAGRYGADLALLGLREGGLTADLGLGVVAAGSGADAVFSARWSRSTTIGLLGAVTVELDGALRTAGEGRLRFGVGGVLGPASVALDLSARTADPERFTIVGLAPRNDEPRLPGTIWGATADIRYRIDRQLLLGIAPGVFVSEAGVGVRMEGSLRWRRAWDDIDALAAWHGWYDPVTNRVAVGLGGGVVWAPRRAPEWRAVAWLGLADGTMSPGLEVGGRAAVAPGIGIDVGVHVQAFRRDVPPYRAFAELAVDVAESELYFRGQAQAQTDVAPVNVGFDVGVRVPLGTP